MILKEVEFKSCKRRADRSLTYQFETLREEDSEALKQGDELIGTRGVIYFAPQITEEQKDAIDKEIENNVIEPQKTKSQVLRYSILKLAKALGKDKEAYYNEMMDKFIDHIQGKL
jgi:hypothetical protein